MVNYVFHTTSSDFPEASSNARLQAHDRYFVGLLAWPNLAALKQMVGDPPLDTAAMITAPIVREHVRKSIAARSAAQQGSSMQIKRVLLMPEPPSIDANEITDKGYINQRAVLERRRASVERLYAAQPAADVIVID